MHIKYAPHALSLIFLTSSVQPSEADAPLVATADFETVRAKVIDPTPSNFTIDLGFPRNLSVDRNAPYIALFDTRQPPQLCADFRDINLKGETISTTQRRYDLSGQPELLEAMQDYRCIVVPNGA